MGRRKEVNRVSADGVFFRCDRCGFEPKMASETDDLLKMNYCPECGCKFKDKKWDGKMNLK